ncbi:MAG TPA: alkaline phosphatase family protein [Longimicrobiales bacterium]|nr:alkaline phosphatase family protein [Longimicrobiales bacterium]
MKKFHRAGVLALALAALGANGLRAQTDAPPSLVVMIVVDQLGGDLVDRYEPAFDGGLRRFMDQGYRFTQASHAHAMTETAPGHATLATGVHPSRHGVVANNWLERSEMDWSNMYAVGDADHPILGFENEPVLEGRSPRNLLRGGIADWVLDQDPEARTVSISKKDRAAVTMAGRTSQNAWWLLDQLGIFITSTYYADAYPEWITRFNGAVMPGLALDSIWDNEVPEQLRELARPDSADYEQGGATGSSFPHIGTQVAGPVGSQEFNMWAFDQPRADDAVLDLAKAAIDELDLGQREGHVDFLALSFSGLDRVGHAYGPFSQEAFSTLVHVDGVLADLLSYLDESVGEGRWVAGLAGDHGALENPEAAREGGNSAAERVDEAQVRERMTEALREAALEGPDPQAIATRLAELVEERGIVERAYTHQELMGGGEPSDSFAILYRNSLHLDRAWGILSRFGVEVRYAEGKLVTPYPTGTNHGSPYWYDRHIEMMFLGAGVPHAVSGEPVYTTDFAPTLAGIGGVRTPGDLDGRQMF